MTKPGANADPKRDHRIDRETTSPSPSKTRLESASNRHHLPTLSFKRQQVQVQPRPRHTQYHGAMQPPRCSSGGSAWRAAWRTSSQPIPEDGRAPERVQGWSVQGAMYVGSGTTTKDTDRIEDASHMCERNSLQEHRRTRVASSGRCYPDRSRSSEFRSSLRAASRGGAAAVEGTAAAAVSADAVIAVKTALGVAVHRCSRQGHGRFGWKLLSSHKRGLHERVSTPCRVGGQCKTH